MWSRVSASVGALAAVLLSCHPGHAQEWLSPKPLSPSKPPQRQAQPVQQKPAQPAPQQAKPVQAQNTQQQPQGQAAEAIAPAFAGDFGDWRTTCFDKPNKYCQISQRQINPQTQQTLIWLELTRAVSPKPSTRLSVVVPLGIRIAPVLNISADKSVVAGAQIVTCVPAGCMHQVEINNNGLALMQKVENLSTQFSDINGRTYQLRIPLRGFRDAYAKSGEFLKGG